MNANGLALGEEADFEALNCLLKVASFLEAKAYLPLTLRNYMAEMRFIFAYYNHLNPEQLTQDHNLSRVSGSPPTSHSLSYHFLFYVNKVRSFDYHYLAPPKRKRVRVHAVMFVYLFFNGKLPACRQTGKLAIGGFSFLRNFRCARFPITSNRNLQSSELGLYVKK